MDRQQAEAVVARQRAPSRVVRAVAACATVALSVGCALAVGEAATRFAFRNVRSTASGGGYFNRRAPSLRKNRHGYRDDEFVVPKPPGVYRVAVVGDSITFGGGLDEKDRFTSLLDEHLRESGGEVLNLGFPARDLPQHVAAVRDDALPLNPDFILLQLFVNDFDDPDEERPREISGWFTGVNPWLERRSALYTVARIEWDTVKGETGMMEDYPHYMRRILSDQAMPASIKANRNLLTIIRMCRQAKCPLGVVFFPHFAFDLTHDYPFAYLNDRVERICREEGVPYLDLRPVFSVAHRDELEVNRFDAHPSAKASRMAAAAILHAFGPLWRAAHQ